MTWLGWFYFWNFVDENYVVCFLALKELKLNGVICLCLSHLNLSWIYSSNLCCTGNKPIFVESVPTCVWHCHISVVRSEGSLRYLRLCHLATASDSSVSILYVCGQQMNWPDCVTAQAGLSLSCLHTYWTIPYACCSPHQIKCKTRLQISAKTGGLSGNRSLLIISLFSWEKLFAPKRKKVACLHFG